MTLRTVVRCPRGCAPPVGYGLRVGDSPEPVPVRICWECGTEPPPLIEQKPDPRWSTCPCGKAVYATLRRRERGRGRFCSRRCQGVYVNPIQYRRVS